MSKRLRIGLLVVVALYGLFSIINYTNSNDPSGVFSLRYKFNKPTDEINLKTHGQTNDLENPNTPNELPKDASLRQQLAFQFPYEPLKPMPKYIWQTWKTDIDDKTFPPSFKHYVTEWKTSNPQFTHKLLPDAACHELIRTLYQSVPDVINAYELMPHSILKADFFRYLILFARGGVYSDVDTFGLKGIGNWPSFSSNYEFFQNHKNIEPKDVGIMIGIEADPDRPDWADWYARRIQFCQWTIQAKKGHPLLGNLITKITEITLDRDENSTIKLANGKDEGADIMNWTGPGIFTDEIFNYLNNISNHNPKIQIINDNVQEKPPQNGLADSKLDAIENKKKINWKLFTGMEEMIAIDDVLILPITSFSPGVGQMGSKDVGNIMAFVKHMFKGSWKNNKQ
ncbi:initiation-specific alpha-1,6-mannosyltransferase [Saccharomycopsis crataegensis]|uniref:Initiation-specific alpha-1,6-mannosyltransferase n=1 Tax=Saccharomycopsis crataegensis TaxID=43959 RepID=A0AAV5QT47_9ASCO|nr:initiation-specific alpha-1,6-mannosyltransferase [Saccharomycopsis crataegensis]